MHTENNFKKTKCWLLLLAFFASTFSVQAATPLADKPLFSGTAVPGNVALTLSVEFPTALGSAYSGGSDYSTGTTYLGYFDTEKCYQYHTEAADTNHYFEPVGAAASHVCVGYWSGNFLNWALTQTIDPLRQALTGGYRSVDVDGLTLLEKAWASGQGGTVVDKTISTAALVTGATPYGAAPYNWTAFKIRINGHGNTFVFSRTGNTTTPSRTTALPEVPDSGADGSLVYRMYARVQVCKSAALKESNCTVYPNGNLKPTGLIQKNATKLNFAAFGYLNDPGKAPVTVDDNRNRRIDGGVLRARMAPLGPMKPVPGAADEINAAPEWDGNTGIFIVNPDTTAATASGVTNSGVINYLNKFGLTSGSYKKFDPVSELYYTTIRYLKHQGNIPAYTSMAEYSVAEKVVLTDGFPVITDWDDPIKYSCQANFIIGVGDTNSHVDGNLPGSTTPGVPSAAMPAEVLNDTTVNARDATNRVGELQGIGTIGGYYTGTNNTRLIAGLAYDSHTVDMRPDITGSQTVSTYWLDVLESNFVANNQYFLATKFGGFDVPAGYDPYSAVVTPLTTTQWDKNADGDPDNYFRANNPGLMITNLGKAFDDILKKISGSSSAFAVISPDVASGDVSYATSYTVEGWTGDVIGSSINVTGDTATATPVWNAVSRVETQNWDTGRYIATANCTVLDATAGTQTCVGKPFRLADLSTGNLSNLVAADQQSMLNFLRGDRGNAGTLGTKAYRDRTKILGDIVNSKVAPVGAPRANYTDEFNPGYSAFKGANASRLKVAYVGANDGMLHAFNGSLTGGNEIFSYIPQALFAGPNNTPADDGLVALAKTSYVHHYYVDATPIVRDVKFGGAWHSLLVGGLGKGGKAYYAIDVTNPGSLSSEGNLASAVKWEFKHKHMGYTFGRALMVKTAKYGWVVILTSGYNNDDGKGYFFIVDPATGNLLENPIATGVGSTTEDAGLAHASMFVPDSRDFTADAVYAGDLLGNVWRLDLTGTSGNYSAPTKIATLASSSGGAQPVTTPPVVEFDQSTSKRFVFVGTGRLLADSDVTNTQEQTFYAINDGTQSAFFTSSTAPTAFPFTRANMVDNNSVSGLSSTLPTDKAGWYKDLGLGANGVGYRINSDMRSSAGVIVFVTNLTGGDACNPSGSNRTYAVTYGTGKSVLSSGGSAVGFVSGSGLGTSSTIYNTAPYDGAGKIVICNDSGVCVTYNIDPTGVSGFKQLNWRELPNAN
ncbi:MAG: PilC/PilY family type IV pilus protein [Candidatus Methylopumilus sp.]|jgi:type IV pilus assembly protein PilY1